MNSILIIYIERIVQLFTGFVTTYLLVNYFSPGDYGIYKYILSLSSLFVIAILLGFNVSNVRYIPQYLVEKSYNKINYQITVYFLIQLILVIAIILVSIVLIKNGQYTLDQRISVPLLMTIIFSNYLKSYFGESLHVAFSKRVQLTLVRLVLNMAQLLIILFFVYIDGGDILSFQHFLALYCVLEATALIFGVALFYKDEVKVLDLKIQNIKHTISYSAYNYGFSWVNFMRDNAATTLVVAYLFSYKEVAYYSIALIIPNIIRGFTPSKVFNGFLMPHYVKSYIETNNKSIVFDELGLIAKLNFLYLFSATLYSIYMYKWVITSYFGIEYSNKTFSLSILLFVNIAILSYVDLGLLLFNTLNRADLVFKANFASISNVCFLFIFHKIGSISIGLANLLSTLLTVIVLYYSMKKVWGKTIALGLDTLILVPYILVAWIGFHLLSTIGTGLTAVLGPLYALSLLILIFRMNFFDINQKKVIREALPLQLRFLI